MSLFIYKCVLKLSGLRCTSCCQHIESILEPFTCKKNSIYINSYSLSFPLSKIFIEVCTSDKTDNINNFFLTEVIPAIEANNFSCSIESLKEITNHVNVKTPSFSQSIFITTSIEYGNDFVNDLLSQQSQTTIKSKLLPEISINNLQIVNQSILSFNAVLDSHFSILLRYLPRGSTLIKATHVDKACLLSKSRIKLKRDLIFTMALIIFQLIFSYSVLFPYLNLIVLVLTLLNCKFFISVVKNGIRSIHANRITMDSLFAIALLSSFLLSIINLRSSSNATSFMMLLVSIISGKLLEDSAVQRWQKINAKSHKLIFARYTFTSSDGCFVEHFVSSELLLPGDLVRVLPGETVPTDGKLVFGSYSFFDESNISGESIPVFKQSNNKSDFIFAGSINIPTGSPIIFECTTTVEDSILSSILQVTENAISKKGKLQGFADKITRFFLPAIILLSFSTLLIQFIISSNFFASVEIAISVLVAACPCALALAAPIIFSSAIKIARLRGVIFKDVPSFESLSNIKHFFFDKTGTITTGKLNLDGMIFHPSNRPDSFFILSLIKRIAVFSTHPICTSLMDQFNSIDDIYGNFFSIENLHEYPGKGLACDILQDTHENTNFSHSSNQITHILSILKEKHSVPALFGNQSLLESYGVKVNKLKYHESTTVLFAINNNHVATISFSESMRENARSTFEQLMVKYKCKCSLITGDKKGPALAIATQLGLENSLHYECDPFAKAKIIKDALRVSPVAMVGDGVNDAAAMASATLSISLSLKKNGVGSMEGPASGMIILNDSPLSTIIEMIELSKKAKLWVFALWLLSIVYNGIMIPIEMGFFSRSVHLPPAIASILMSLSGIIVLLSGNVFYHLMK